jgi:hypothetical protein
MFAKLAIRLEQLAALLFLEPFRREAAATFFGKFLFQRHARPCCTIRWGTVATLGEWPVNADTVVARPARPCQHPRIVQVF